MGRETMRQSFIVVMGIVAILFLGACSPPPFDDGTDSTTPPVTVTPNDGTARPDIPRTNPPADTPDNTEYKNPGEQTHSWPQVVINNKTPSVDLDIPLGEELGDAHPFITSKEFPLLRHQPIRVSGNELVGYDETLRFAFGNNTTGTVAFAKVDEELGTFMRFERGKPVFEYRITLYKGTFIDMQGRDIQILGHTYVIAEATNTSVALFGKSIPSNLFFEQDEPLEVNGTSVRESMCNITPRSISYTLYTKGNDDGRNIMLSPGESLRDNLGWHALASAIFDIEYKGNPAQNATLMFFKRTKHGYDLEIVTWKGRLQLPIIEEDAGRLILGSIDERLRVTPCPASNPYCIAPDTIIPLTTGDGRTFIVKYDAAHFDPNTIRFSDLENNRYSYEYLGTPGATNGTVDILLEDARFRVRIGPLDNATGTYNISVDQGFRNGIAEILDKNGAAVRIGNITGNVLGVELVLPWAKVGGTQERIALNISHHGGEDWRVAVRNMTLLEDEDTDDYFGSTGYGALVLLRNKGSPAAPGTGDEADILLPRGQLHGTVSLQG
ncbi:TPA: hypothetical protein HA251_06695 [Candidatus Woesearchaeota archaeon]|nr:hypothetical protein [Candidatus Woesearchaeota archaeon]